MLQVRPGTWNLSRGPEFAFNPDRFQSNTGEPNFFAFFFGNRSVSGSQPS